MTDFGEWDLRQYCALTRARFYVDPETDAEWFFGNRQVENELLQRMESDVDVRGVPKCGVVGRFGIGKTHTLNHVRWLTKSEPDRFRVEAVSLDVVWDEGNRDLNSWKAVHSRMLDALGEPLLRDIVRKLDAKNTSREELSDAIRATFRFGDENLRRSLSIVLADYFKREARATAEAWQWMRGEKGAKLETLGATKVIADAGDMVFVILNLGCLAREATGNGLLFLMDEAQSLGNVRRADSEVHRALLKLAEPDNRDVGFIVAVFGGGAAQIPKVLTTPEDVLSRLGVTRATLNAAFIELQRVLTTKNDIRAFLDEVLEHLVDEDRAQTIISAEKVSDVLPKHLPFTEDALTRAAEVLHNREENRNPRIAIDTLAKCCSRAYRKARESSSYQTVTVQLADEVLKDF